MKTHQPAHLKSIKTKEREIRYAIGEELECTIGEKRMLDKFGMWDGPNPDVKIMLETEGVSNKSRIIRFNKDGTDEIIWWWNDKDEVWEDEPNETT